MPQLGTSMRQVMQARRPQLAELGVFLLVVALPLVFTPFSASPFGDPKLVVLTAGTLALWGSGLQLDRRLSLAAAVWVGITIVAALVGVDPTVGLTARTEGSGGGAILIACVGVLAVLGAALPIDLRDSARRWVVVSGAVVAALGLTVRVFPGLSTLMPSDIEMIGATVGNQLFAAAFVAVALAAAIGGAARTPLKDGEDTRDALDLRSVGLVAFLAMGAATFGERSSIVLPVVATAAVLWRAKLGARATFVMAAAVIGPVLVWQLLDATAFPDTTGRGEAVTGITAQTTDLDRMTTWRTMARGALDRLMLGWGPGSADSAYLATATSADIDETGRGWSDAHNLFIETCVTSGILGLAALVWLVALLVVRSFRGSPDQAWAFGAAAGLAAYSLVEPLGLVLTPLLFLFAGVAAAPPSTILSNIEAGIPSGDWPSRRSRILSLAVALALSIAAIVSVQMLVAASLERWGRVYGETWALESALRIQPWRLSASEVLALSWALDGRAGDEAAGERARGLIAEAVRDHPWDSQVRLRAADIETLLRDEAAARAWIEQHLERFPGDSRGLVEAREGGDGIPGENPLPGA